MADRYGDMGLEISLQTGEGKSVQKYNMEMIFVTKENVAKYKDINMIFLFAPARRGRRASCRGAGSLSYQ
jgi:hypothetical protein